MRREVMVVQEVRRSCGGCLPVSLIFINPGGASVRETLAPTTQQEKTMKILVAADGSDYTKRMLAYLAAHDEWLGAKHEYTVVHGVLAVPHRAAAFVGANVVREF